MGAKVTSSNSVEIIDYDADGDGYGDQSDAFPNDSNEWADSDSDGVGDNADAFDDDNTQTTDSDGDGYGDNASGNNPDAFPNDANEWLDSDNDGVGDNADAFPNDPTERLIPTVTVSATTPMPSERCIGNNRFGQRWRWQQC